MKVKNILGADPGRLYLKAAACTYDHKERDWPSILGRECDHTSKSKTSSPR